MKAREFCVQPGFQIAILSCFNFDPLFFERVVLPALRQGGADRVLVLADRGAVNESVSRWAGQAVNLGRRYLLALPNADGAFHPKFMLRISRIRGAFWIGSGNLTTAGWGMNQEVAASWHLGPDDEDRGGWLAALMAALRRWCTNDVLASEFLREVDGHRWWPAPESASPVLLQGPGQRSLAGQLADRWSGRRLGELRLATGSTDRDGAFLSWAHKEFGAKRAIVAADPARVSFDPDKLNTLPLDVRVAVQPGMHAKFFWFEGPEGHCAVLGSANCSAAAWFGHNTEAMLVYDDADRDAFAPLLDRLNDGQAADDVLTAPMPEHTSETEGPVWQVVAARLNSLGDEIALTVTPLPPEDATLTLYVEDAVVPLEALSSPGHYVAAAPRSVTESGRTVFCTVVVASGGREGRTNLRWIDDTAALSQTVSHRGIAGTVDGLLKPGDEPEQQRLLHDVRLVTDAIFDGTPSFIDPEVPDSGSDDYEQQKKTEENAPALDPANMFVNLFEAGADLPTATRSLGRWNLPLLGVMHALFGRPSHDTGDDEAPDDEGNADDARRPSSRSAPRTPPSEELREQLKEQIEEFLRRYAEQEDCESRELRVVRSFTATDLVQATAYPLAIASLGLESGWVEEETARRWVRTLCDLLFHQLPPGPGKYEAGLLGRARRRFEEEGRAEVFDRVVGDGTLWLTVCSAVAALPMENLSAVDSMHTLMSWRALWTRRELLSAADAPTVQRLLRRLRVERAREALREYGLRAYRSLTTIETWLHDNADEALKAQALSATPHRPGDPLWGKVAGWAVFLREEPGEKGYSLVHLYRRARAVKVRVGRVYVNLRVAAQADNDLRGLLRAAGLATAAS